MAKHKFRSFLYLDKREVDDFLAQAEGGLTRDDSEETERTSRRNPSDETDELLEVRRRRSDTPEARFNRLYEALQQNGDMKTFVTIDQSQYDGLEVGDIIEVRGIARLPQWERIKEDFAAVSSLVPLMQALGQDPLEDPAAREAFEGFGQLTSMKGQEDTMLIVTAPGPLTARLVAKLKHVHLGRPKDELEGEVTIVAKVRRRLERGQQIEASRLLPNLQGLQALNRAQMNREQRRRAAKQDTQQLKTGTPLDEVVKFPAVEVLPIAVFQ